MPRPPRLRAGVTVRYAPATESITVSLPDGSRLIVAQPVAVHAPGDAVEKTAHALTPAALVEAMQVRVCA